MDPIAILTAALTLISGVGVFLIACTMMSSNLEALGSRRLKTLFSKTKENRLVGVGVGAAATAVIQSSSATSVIVIGLLNAGIITHAQAATVIFGANIGTTVTGQIVAIGLFGGNTISASVVFAAFSGVGAFILAFSKKDKTKKLGGITAGFGLLFVGLSVMSEAMSGLSGSDKAIAFLATFKSPLLLVFVGMLFTALVQSSSVTTSLAITMTVTGLITLDQGIYLTIGSNIGTCVTALIAGLFSSTNAKRASLVHLLFNVGGAAVFLIAGLIMRLFGADYGMLFVKMFPHAPQMQLAMFHTIFNVITVCVFLPLVNPLVKLVTKLVHDKDTSGKEHKHAGAKTEPAG